MQAEPTQFPGNQPTPAFGGQGMMIEAPPGFSQPQYAQQGFSQPQYAQQSRGGRGTRGTRGRTFHRAAGRGRESPGFFGAAQQQQQHAQWGAPPQVMTTTPVPVQPAAQQEGILSRISGTLFGRRSGAASPASASMDTADGTYAQPGGYEQYEAHNQAAHQEGYVPRGRGRRGQGRVISGVGGRTGRAAFNTQGGRASGRATPQQGRGRARGRAPAPVWTDQAMDDAMDAHEEGPDDVDAHDDEDVEEVEFIDHEAEMRKALASAPTFVGGGAGRGSSQARGCSQGRGRGRGRGACCGC